MFTQGVRNLNDGVSLFTIADGALTELSNIVVRLQELAEQSANGVYTDFQRKALDNEARALKDEFFRISQTTEFNGQKLLTGENAVVDLQAGIGENAILSVGVGGAIGTGEFEEASNFSVGAFPRSVTTGDFNGDGILDIITSDYTDQTISIALGNGTGGFSATTSYATDGGGRSITTGDLNGDGRLDIITANTMEDSISVLLGDGAGGFQEGATLTGGFFSQVVTTGDFNEDGILDIITGTGIGTASVFLGDGSGQFELSNTLNPGGSIFAVEAEDLNGDGTLDLVFTDFTNNEISLFLGDGDGGFGSETSISVGLAPNSAALGDYNGDGSVDIAIANQIGNTVSILLGDGSGEFSIGSTLDTGPGPSSLIAGDFDGDSVLDLLTSNGTDDTASVLLGSTTQGVAPLLDFSLKTLADARQALPVFDKKLEQLAAQRGEIGANLARIEVAANTLSVSTENFLAAESRIRDADVASETARLIRNNILQQAAASILAQANQQPALALQLLT